jgi:hypothetical protein
LKFFRLDGQSSGVQDYEARHDRLVREAGGLAASLGDELVDCLMKFHNNENEALGFDCFIGRHWLAGTKLFPERCKFAAG